MSNKIVRGFTSTVVCNHEGACRLTLDAASFQGVQVTGEEIQSKYYVWRITITWIKHFKKLEKHQVDYVAEKPVTGLIFGGCSSMQLSPPYQPIQLTHNFTVGFPHDTRFMSPQLPMPSCLEQPTQG